MRIHPLFALALALAAATSSHQADDARNPEDEEIRAYLSRHRAEMIRVTEQPFYVIREGSTLCMSPNATLASPHEEHWIRVYVSPAGYEILLKGQGIHPLGTYILKEKFLDARGEKTDFYTGMRKREPGYNPDLGDWEFFTLDARGQEVTARGKIDSCMGCHRAWKNSDFTSRRYLTGPAKP